MDRARAHTLRASIAQRPGLQYAVCVHGVNIICGGSDSKFFYQMQRDRVDCLTTRGQRSSQAVDSLALSSLQYTGAPCALQAGRAGL